MRRLLATLLAILTAIPGPWISAQTSIQRIRLGGYVHDAQGQAWVGADVHLVSRLMPGNEWIGPADEIHVKSGHRGKFVAQVIPGREYLIWAVSEPSDGIYRSTKPLVGVRSGPVRLYEQSSPLVQVAVSIVGDKSWQRPFQAKVTGAPSKLALGDQRVGNPYEVFPMPLDAQGHGKLPLLPWKEVTVEIYDKRGAQLWAPSVKLAHGAREAGLAADPGEEKRTLDMLEKMVDMTHSELRLPQPVERSVRILEAGKQPLPLANAELCQRIRGKLVVLSRSDAKGKVTTQLPLRHESHYDRIFRLRGASRLVIRKQGYAEISAETYSGTSVRKASILGTTGGRVLVLEKSSSHRGRVLLRPGKPLANTQLILYVRASGQVPHPVLMTTDDSGNFSFNQRTQPAWFLMALLDDATRQTLSATHKISMSRDVILGASAGKMPDKEGNIDLSRVRLIKFHLKRSDGGPASLAHLDGFRIPGFNAIPPIIQMRADRRGELGLLVQDCHTMLIVAQDEQGFASRRLQDCEAQTTLLLGGVLKASGVIKDKQGRIVPGASIRVEPKFLYQFANQIIQRRKHGNLTLIPFFHLGHHFRSRSDAKGRFSLWVPKDTESLPVLISPQDHKTTTARSIEMEGSSRRRVELVID